MPALTAAPRRAPPPPTGTARRRRAPTRDRSPPGRELGAIPAAPAARGYRTLTLAEAAARRRGGQRLPRRSVVLTFDDGCRCFRDHAAPELAARGMTATLFAVSGELGGSNRWDRPERAGGAAEPVEGNGLGPAAAAHGSARAADADGSAGAGEASGSARAAPPPGAPPERCGARRAERLRAAALPRLPPPRSAA